MCLPRKMTYNSDIVNAKVFSSGRSSGFPFERDIPCSYDNQEFVCCWESFTRGALHSFYIKFTFYWNQETS